MDLPNLELLTSWQKAKEKLCIQCPNFCVNWRSQNRSYVLKYSFWHLPFIVSLKPCMKCPNLILLETADVSIKRQLEKFTKKGLNCYTDWRRRYLNIHYISLSCLWKYWFVPTFVKFLKSSGKVTDFLILEYTVSMEK